MENTSTNVPPKEQQPPTPTVQIPAVPPVSLVQQPPQDQSPPKPSSAISATPVPDNPLERLVQSPSRTTTLSHHRPQDQSPKSPKPSGVPTRTTTRHVQASGNSPSSGRHSSYRGIRSRSGKWVSEIREPRKTTRIWLGTYPTPEMAATAYDVAAIALKGPDTDLNFPDRILSYPKVDSTSATDIRAAAAATAAASILPKADTESSSSKDSKQGKPDENEGTTSSSTCCMEESGSGQEYIDEEELLNFPNLMVDMAEGMLVSPPRMNSSPPSDDSPHNSDVESLWTYT